MTFCILQKTIEDYYLSIEQGTHNGVYIVSAHEKRGVSYYQISVNSYTELKKAKARYNYLIRKAKSGEL